MEKKRHDPFSLSYKDKTAEKKQKFTAHTKNNKINQIIQYYRGNFKLYVNYNIPSTPYVRGRISGGGGGGGVKERYEYGRNGILTPLVVLGDSGLREHVRAAGERGLEAF